MESAKRISRIAGLAIGLGIGAALAATPGVASADPQSPLVPDVAASVDGLTGTLGTAAVDPVSLPGLNVAISMDGMTFFQEGTAIALSGTGNDIAIAIGPESYANDVLGGDSTALAVGAGSTALANLGSNDTATAYGTDASAVASVGNHDTATALGTDTIVFAEFGNNDTATALGTDSTATAGGIESPQGVEMPGDADTAIAFDGTAADASPGSDLFVIEPSFLDLFGLL
jgi:hypothetical protein